MFYLEPGGQETEATVRLLIGIDPPKPAWRANLLDAQQKQIASVPLTKDKQILHSSLAPGAFVVQVAFNEDILAECRLKIQSSP